MIDINNKDDFDNLKNHKNHPQLISINVEGDSFLGFTTLKGEVWVRFEQDTLYKVTEWEQVLPECDQIDEYIDSTNLEEIIPMLIKG